MPVDERRGLIRNSGGRVCDEAGRSHRGEYVVGWIKRGPSGVIATNKKDAADTVARIVEDRDAGTLDTPQVTDPEAIAAFYVQRAPDSVTWAGWEAIDAHEKSSGEPHGRPRVKLVRLAVDDVHGVVDRVRAAGWETVGEVVDYENTFLLCYVRGPEGLIVELAERLDGAPG